jgi:hypothetical protein
VIGLNGKNATRMPWDGPSVERRPRAKRWRHAEANRLDHPRR